MDDWQLKPTDVKALIDRSYEVEAKLNELRVTTSRLYRDFMLLSALMIYGMLALLVFLFWPREGVAPPSVTSGQLGGIAVVLLIAGSVFCVQRMIVARQASSRICSSLANIRFARDGVTALDS